MIVVLVLDIPYSIYDIANGHKEAIMTDREPSTAEQIIEKILTILFLIYEIFVIHSLEKMFREQSLPVIQQPGFVYQPYPQQELSPQQQLYPQQQAPGVIPQPYYANQNATAPYPTNPTNYPIDHNFPVKS